MDQQVIALRLRFLYSVFKCVRFQITPLSNGPEPLPLLRFWEEGLVRNEGFSIAQFSLL